MKKISVRRKQLPWWHSWKHYTRQIKSQRAMLLKQRNSTEARFPNARRSYHVGSPSPSRILAALARRHLRSDYHGIVLFARLASFSTCFPKPHPHVATCCIYRWTLLSVDSGRVSSG